jgi:hypothetical protein
MDLFSFAGSFAHSFSGFQLDDSSVALIALLAGMMGGYRLTGWHERFKAKRAKLERKPSVVTRKQD